MHHPPRSLIIFLLAFFGMLSNSSAQSVPIKIINTESYGVIISSPRATKLSPEVISNLSCTLANLISKPVVGYVVLWTLWLASGAKSTSANTMEASPMKSSVILQPGQSIETDTDIEDSATASSANPFVQIEVRLDYVLFADGSKAGKDTLKIGERISYGRQTADRLRDQLLKVYQGA
jgi:hypothetical protein